MLTTPFLTQLDSRAEVKGSRDPLGVQAIWSRLGRSVVGNLTTVSNSVRDFSILLLGYHFIEQVGEDNQSALSTFLKWEQLASYARAKASGERGFRGTTRVHRRLQEERRVHLGVDAKAQILGNQKTYGLWGLFTVPAKASGLLGGEPTRLSVEAREVVANTFVRPLEAELSQAQRLIIGKLKKPAAELDLQGGQDARLLEAIAGALRSSYPARTAAYRKHLLDGGPAGSTEGRQPLLAELLQETLGVEDWSLNRHTLADLIKRATTRGEVGQSLAARLDRIRTMEATLAPAAALFNHALGCHGQELQDLARKFEAHWGNALHGLIEPDATEELRGELSQIADPQSAKRWCELARALASADYGAALQLVLDQNAAVMSARGGSAPWITLRDNRLDVRFVDEEGDGLPAADELPHYWRNPYFIDSLRSIASQLQSEP